MKLMNKYKKVQILEIKIKKAIEATTKQKAQTELEKVRTDYDAAVEKFKETEKKAEEVVHKDEKSVKYAFIVFRSEEGMQRAIRAFNISKASRCFTRCCKCCCSKKHQVMESKYFYGRWLDISNAGLPDEINW